MRASSKAARRASQTSPAQARYSPRWRDPDAIRDGVDALDRQAHYRGFSLHAATAVGAGRREALEQLCRYVLPAAIDEDRLAWTRDGKVYYRFEWPWKDVTKLLVFSREALAPGEARTGRRR
ncbi:MAG: transposase [Planctomycetes bacterium]|nr:transposase [Planctomycetota bacterium]